MTYLLHVKLEGLLGTKATVVATNAIKHSQLLHLVIILTTQDLKNQNGKDNHMHYMYDMLANKKKTAKTESERKAVEVSLELATLYFMNYHYYNVITSCVIDPMHCLFLGIAKKFLKVSCIWQNNLTPNMHLATHIIECIKDHGPVYSFWLFAFKRMNGKMGSIPIQLMRKLTCMQTTDI